MRFGAGRAAGAAVTLIAGAALGGCKGGATPPEVRALDAGERAVPEVVTAEHALLNALWRRDGHLLVLTPSELVDLDPDALDAARRYPVHEATRLAGRNGGERVLVDRAEGWETWDIASTPLRPLAHGEAHGRTSLSADGALVAAPVCEPSPAAPRCRYLVADAATGAVRATIDSPGQGGDAGDFAFLSADTTAAGHAWATVTSGAEMVIADLATGQPRLHRKLGRMTEGGLSRELLEIRGAHAYLTSTSGFEVVDLPSGRVLVRQKDPQPLEDITVTISDDGRTVTEASTFAETSVSAWDVPVGASVAKPAAAPAAPSSPSSPAQLVQVVQSGNLGRETCRVDVDKWTVASGPAYCDDSTFVSDRNVVPGAALAGASPDGRYFASLHGGTLTVLSLRSGANVASIGPPPDRPFDPVRRLSLTGGAPHLRDRTGRDLWLTQSPPAGVVPAVDDSMARTRTHVFRVEHGASGLVVSAIDRAGREVLRAPVAGGDAGHEELFASESTAFVSGGRSSDPAIRCDVGSGCHDFEPPGRVVAFTFPWVVLYGPSVPREVAPGRAGLDPPMDTPVVARNLVTGAEHVFSEACRPGIGYAAVLAGPRFLCGSRHELALEALDGSRVALPVPDPQMLVSERDERFLYLAGIATGGAATATLLPILRVDVNTGDAVPIFAAAQSAIARFADGQVEIFGDEDEARRSIVCTTATTWTTAASCLGSFLLAGRLDQARAGDSSDTGRVP